MQQEQTQSHPFNENKFYMWRCVIALAHADGLIHHTEEAYLNKIFDNFKRLGLPEEDYEILQDDLVIKQKIEDLLPNITEAKYRGQVVYFARLLAFKDDKLHPSEQDLIEILHANALSEIDLEEIKKQVHENVETELTLHEMNIEDTKEQKGFTGLIAELLYHFGIDLLG
jgi:uncharacterized membrane protein YebE (DUF533 family)